MYCQFKFIQITLVLDIRSIQFCPILSVIVQFVPSDDPEQEGKKVTSYKIQYTKEDPGLEDAQWNEARMNEYMLPADSEFLFN